MVNNKDQSVKRRILDAGIKLFLANGFRGTSVKELTDAVGVAKGTLYWHFSSKDEILNNILAVFEETFLDTVLEKTGACEGDFLTKFKVFYRHSTEFARDNRELLLVFNTLLGEMIGSNTVAEQRIKDIQSRFHDFVKGLLNEGKKEGFVAPDLDTHIHAHIIIASFTGMHLQWYLAGDTIDPVAYARVFRKVMLAGLADKPE